MEHGDIPTAANASRAPKPRPVYLRSRIALLGLATAMCLAGLYLLAAYPIE